MHVGSGLRFQSLDGKVSDEEVYRIAHEPELPYAAAE